MGSRSIVFLRLLIKLFLRRVLIIATLKDCCTLDGLIISRREVLTRGKTSFSSIVGMGSWKQVSGLDKIIVEISC